MCIIGVSTRLPQSLAVFLCPGREWECWSARELARSKSLDLHQCKKSFSNQGLKRVRPKTDSEPYKSLSIVGELLIEVQFTQQTHVLCALAVKEREIVSLHATPLSPLPYFFMPVKNAIGLARNGSDPQQMKKLSIFSIMCGRAGWNAWGDALLLSLPPKSTNLSIHFEIRQWFIQKPKHMGTCCPVEWQAGCEIPRMCLCREWLLGAIWQLHQTAIWNISRGDVVLWLLYIGKKIIKKSLFAFYNDTLLVVNVNFPESVIHSLKSILPALWCQL